VPQRQFRVLLVACCELNRSKSSGRREKQRAYRKLPVVALRVPREFQRSITALSVLRGERMQRFNESMRLMLVTTKSSATVRTRQVSGKP
jgi:hypothetical protein